MPDRWKSDKRLLLVFLWPYKSKTNRNFHRASTFSSDWSIHICSPQQFLHSSSAVEWYIELNMMASKLVADSKKLMPDRFFVNKTLPQAFLHHKREKLFIGHQLFRSFIALKHEIWVEKIFFPMKNLQKILFRKISKSTKFENPEITKFYDFSKIIFFDSRFFSRKSKIFEKNYIFS